MEKMPSKNHARPDTGSAGRKRNPFQSIKAKLLIFTLCISLIPIVLISTLGYIHARRTLKEETLHRLTAVAESRKAHLEAFMEGKKERTIDFSSDEFIKDSLDKIRLGGPGKDDTATALSKHLLENKKPLDPYLKEIEVVDLNGRVVASTHEALIGNVMSNHDVAYTKTVDKNYAETYFGSPHYTPYLEANSICIAAPISARGSDEPSGVLINHYDMVFLNEIAGNRAGLGETGEVLLGNKTGDEIKFLSPLLYAPDAPLTLSIPVDSTGAEPMRLALEGKSGALIAPDYRDVTVLAAYQSIPSLGWGLVAKIDESEAFAPVKMIGLLALIVGLVSVAAVVSVAFLFAASTSRPIKRLRDATRRFTEGDLGQRVNISRRDEIGDLADSFNTMAGELSTEITAHEYAEEQLRKQRDYLRKTSDAL
ncbi:MAG: HAMP domain-containing protein, partial [Candidatus Brocadiales bacterium]|nr:HAMP domain-containing protein [Candidatus Bathyanammoxibius sp.]